jgi:hypothetical protein
VARARVATFARRLAKAREARENKNQNKGNSSTPEEASQRLPLASQWPAPLAKAARLRVAYSQGGKRHIKIKRHLAKR